MLFSSFEFILVFLPVTWCVWRLLHRYAPGTALGWVTVCSIFFYGWWKPGYLSLLLFGLLLNYAIAYRVVLDRVRGNDRGAMLWCTSGVLIDLAAVGYYKYAAFAAANFGRLFGQEWQVEQQVLPLGISFISFSLIAYLVDCYRRVVAQDRLRTYLFFVTFFPHLIAGPIVHQKPIVDQLDWRSRVIFPSSFVSVGLFVFAVGLFKKVILADSFARYVGPVFESAEKGLVPAATALVGTLSYAFQIYFDFSGYSDMAIGLGLLFGIRLPVNFLSPYKAPSIIEFWRRWHITLSGFLRDHVYIPIGGAARGGLSRYRNIVITMLVGGLWHGAGWTFVVWGALHGVALVVNHAWRAACAGRAEAGAPALRVPHAAGVAMTFLSVALFWILFRAVSVDGATNLYRSLLSGGYALPGRFALDQFLSVAPEAAWGWLLVGALIVWTCPNIVQIIRYDAEKDEAPMAPVAAWKSFLLGLATAVSLGVSLKWLITAPSGDFLYFNF